MSGRPPPLPPTCWATWLTSSPAFTFPVRSLVTPAMSVTLPSETLPSTIAADLSLSFSLSIVSRSAFTSAPSSDAASTFAPFTSTALPARSSPALAAAFALSRASSRSVARALSSNWAMRASISATGALMTAAAAFSLASCACT